MTKDAVIFNLAVALRRLLIASPKGSSAARYAKHALKQADKALATD